jgi:hypothetical protein
LSPFAPEAALTPIQRLDYVSRPEQNDPNTLRHGLDGALFANYQPQETASPTSNSNSSS